MLRDKAGAPREIPWVAISVACAALLFACTQSRNHGEAEDVLGYARTLASGSAQEVFHPNHLAFISLGRAARAALNPLGLGASPIFVLQLLNTIAGAVTIGFFVCSGLRSGWGGRLSWLMAALLTVAYGFWFYSVEGETYVLPLPLLWLTYSSAWEHAERSDTQRLFYVGLWGGLTTLLHQQHVLSCALVIGWCTFQLVRQGRPFQKPLLVALATSGLIVGVAYVGIGAGLLEHHGWGELITWAKGHARGGMWTPFSLASPVKAIVGFTKAIFGLHFLFSFDSFVGPMQKAFPTKILLEEQFLAAHISRPQVLLAALGTLSAGLASLYLFFQLARGARADSAPASPALQGAQSSGLLLTAFGFYATFNTLWEPQNIEFWIAPLLFLAGLLGNAIARLGATSPLINRRLMLTTQVLVASLFVSNLLGSILPQTTSSTDYWYTTNSYLFKNAKKGDLIVTECGHICNGYLRYHTPATTIRLSKVSADELGSALAAAVGDIYVSSWALSPPLAIERSGQLKGWEREQSQRLLESYRSRMVEVSDGQQKVWRLSLARATN